MRDEMNSNRYEILFRLKISLRCQVGSLLVFTRIEVKRNSKLYRFHIGHFDRNEISFRMIKYHVNTIRNELSTYVYQNMSIEMHTKWNFMWTELIFTPVWNIKPVWVHFAFHVNVLLVWFRIIISSMNEVRCACTLINPFACSKTQKLLSNMKPWKMLIKLVW